MVLDNRDDTADETLVSVESALSDTAPSDPVPGAQRPGSTDTTAVVDADTAAVDADTAPPAASLPADDDGGSLPRPGTAMSVDLPSESLPAPPSPQCPVTEEGAWWTDPADPYTCIRPGSIPFHEPTPPGIDPALLEPIFEDAPSGSIPFHEPTPPGIDPALLEPIFEDPCVEPGPVETAAPPVLCSAQ